MKKELKINVKNISFMRLMAFCSANATNPNYIIENFVEYFVTLPQNEQLLLMENFKSIPYAEQDV